VLLFGLPCFLRGMGMGDLKLAAGVGAWIGPSQFWLAFIVTAIVGGILAVTYAVRYRSPGRRLDRTPQSIPYAPAIAIGTLFSFFAR
jgi:Flp pilus assembly protein protease CpaA